MKLLRTTSTARLLVVAAMLLSWLGITNHCALVRLRPTSQAKTEHAHCHGGPAKELPMDSRECCKTLHASLPAKAEVKFDASKFQLHFFAAAVTLAADITNSAAAVFIFDHGPPRSFSFAESVLQRSLLSHAPPFAV